MTPASFSDFLDFMNFDDIKKIDLVCDMKNLAWLVAHSRLYSKYFIYHLGQVLEDIANSRRGRSNKTRKM